MKKEDGFYFIPKKWLGDANIIVMDWDCKGMHLHLMAIAWQQEPKGYILDDDKLLKKILGNPEEWEERIKPQIFSAWKQTMLNVNGVERLYWYQPGLLKATEEVEKPVTRRKKKKESLIVDNPDYEGFNLKTLLSAKTTTTILYENSSEEDKTTIWKLGVGLVKQQGESEGKARGFIAKLIKDYGEKPVAEAIAQLSLKSIPPAEVHSYLIGILKKQQTEGSSKKATGRGMVSI